jgi:hypothetical protein
MADLKESKQDGTTDIRAHDVRALARYMVRHVGRDALVGDWRGALLHLVFAVTGAIGMLVLSDPAALGPEWAQALTPGVATGGFVLSAVSCALGFLQASLRSMLPAVFAWLVSVVLFALQVVVPSGSIGLNRSGLVMLGAALLGAVIRQLRTAVGGNG